MVFIQLEQQLQLLINLLSNLDDEQYTRRISHLSNASIGGHSRHIIELLQCAINGYTPFDFIHQIIQYGLKKNTLEKLLAYANY